MITVFVGVYIKSQLQHVFLLLLSRGASYTPNITSYTCTPYICIHIYVGVRLMLSSRTVLFLVTLVAFVP